MKTSQWLLKEENQNLMYENVPWNQCNIGHWPQLKENQAQVKNSYLHLAFLYVRTSPVSPLAPPCAFLFQCAPHRRWVCRTCLLAESILQRKVNPVWECEWCRASCAGWWDTCWQVNDAVGRGAQQCGVWRTLWWLVWDLGARGVSHVVLQPGKLRQAVNINKGSK